MKKIAGLFLITLIIILGILIAQKSKLLNPSQAIPVKPTPTPTPTLAPALKNEVHSPDGTMKIIMQTQKKIDGLTAYSFSVAEISGKNQKLIFAKTVDQNITISIPQNSFSPDNKYIFLEEYMGTSKTALIFKASGEAFAKEEQYLNITSLLTQSKPEYFFKKATGWASPTLVQIFISKDASSHPSSYWFVPETKAFIGPVT